MYNYQNAQRVSHLRWGIYKKWVTAVTHKPLLTLNLIL